MAEEPETIWKALTAKYSSAENLVETCWQEIKEAYTSEKRFYHNLAHLGAMLELTKHYEKQLKNPDAVYFAIFYHDLVYEAGENDNEAKSAALAEKRLKALGVPQETIAVIKTGIIATKSHATQQNSDLNFLLDADLAILGADTETYLEYTKNIRQEYSIYPDGIYKPGRKKVLQHFLALPKIYKTPLFQTLLEAKAYHNLHAELQTL